MNFYTKYALLALTVMALCQTPSANAVFCTAVKYQHPQTKQVAWLLGDIHCDITPQGYFTTLHQQKVLETAQRTQALVIAENIDHKYFRPYLFATALSIEFAALLVALLKKSYPAASAIAAIIAFDLYNIKKAWDTTQKPPFTIPELITELNTYPAETPLLCYSHSPLWSLVQECNKRKIAAIDAEFRYHMVGTVAQETRAKLPWYQQLPYLQTLYSHTFNYYVMGERTRYPLSVEDYFITNDNVVAQLMRQDQEIPVLKNFYASCINNYKESYITQELTKIAQENLDQELATIVPLLTTASGKDSATVLKDFCEHNKDLLDARVAHEIYNNPSYATIFACTGVGHIPSISSALQELGYQEIEAHGKNNWQTLIDRNVIGDTTNTIQIKDLDCFVIDLETILETV